MPLISEWPSRPPLPDCRDHRARHRNPAAGTTENPFSCGVNMRPVLVCGEPFFCFTMESTQDAGELINNKKRWRFCIEKEFLTDDTLSPMARMLYMVIDSYSSKVSPVPFPSIALLCRILCCKEETYRKYRKELEGRGLLRVERHRGAGMKFERNRYHLLDGDVYVEKPSPKKPTMEKIQDGQKPSRPNTTTKSTQDLKIDHSQRRHEVPKPEREKAAGAAQPPSPCLSPSGTYAPPSAPRGTPAEETSKLLTEWGKWYGWFYREAFFVDVKQKKVVQAFFADNPDMTARELMASRFAGGPSSACLHPPSGGRRRCAGHQNSVYGLLRHRKPCPAAGTRSGDRDSTMSLAGLVNHILETDDFDPKAYLISGVESTQEIYRDDNVRVFSPLTFHTLADYIGGGTMARRALPPTAYKGPFNRDWFREGGKGPRPVLHRPGPGLLMQFGGEGYAADPSTGETVEFSEISNYYPNPESELHGENRASHTANDLTDTLNPRLRGIDQNTDGQIVDGLSLSTATSLSGLFFIYLRPKLDRLPV
jgi:hypothetical protein